MFTHSKAVLEQLASNSTLTYTHSESIIKGNKDHLICTPIIERPILRLNSKSLLSRDLDNSSCHTNIQGTIAPNCHSDSQSYCSRQGLQLVEQLQIRYLETQKRLLSKVETLTGQLRRYNELQSGIREQIESMKSDLREKHQNLQLVMDYMRNNLVSETPKSNPKQSLVPKREKFSYSNNGGKLKTKAKVTDCQFKSVRAESTKNLAIPYRGHKNPYQPYRLNRELQTPLVPKSPR